MVASLASSYASAEATRDCDGLETPVATVSTGDTGCEGRLQSADRNTSASNACPDEEESSQGRGHRSTSPPGGDEEHGLSETPAETVASIF